MQQTVRVCHGSDPGVSHPLAGFLAPLELAGLFRPAAVPGLCSPFRAFPSRFRSRTPRRGRWLPCRSSRSDPGAACAVLSPWTFTDSGDVRASSLARSCPELEAPFQRRSSHSLATARLAAPPGHPGPRTPDSPRSGRSVDFEAFFPARVRSHHAAVARRAEAGALLGVVAPPEPCSRQARGPVTRHGRRRPSSRWQRAPLGATRDPEDSLPPGTSPGLRHERSDAGNPRRRVDSAWTTETSCAMSVGGHRADPARAVLPLRQQPRLP